MLFRNLLTNICDYWGAFLIIFSALVFFTFASIAAYKADKRADARKKAEKEAFYMQNPEAVKRKHLEDSLYNQYLKEQ